jgi:glycosyltransferase involved in cell wall biosynthesis
LNGRKTVTRIWKWIEDHIFPKLKHVIAVNQSVADLYSKEYGNHIEVIRNVPFKKPLNGSRDKSSMQISQDQKIILYQGAVNVDRGLEEAILAMKYLKTDGILVIAGIGDEYDRLQTFASDHGVDDKVRFLGQVPFQELHTVTRMADIGLSIEKDVSINYHYCLPNKFLDYIQANIPVLVSPFPEMKAIVDQYRIGDFIQSHDPKLLASQLDELLNDHERMAGYKANLVQAAEELCWEREEGKLIRFIQF